VKGKGKGGEKEATPRTGSKCNTWQPNKDHVIQLQQLFVGMLKDAYLSREYNAERNTKDKKYLSLPEASGATIWAAIQDKVEELLAQEGRVSCLLMPVRQQQKTARGICCCVGSSN
jgi:hypothetical protein